MVGGAQSAVVVFAKTFVADVMVTCIYYRGRCFLTLTEAASEEQQLVDTLFPQIFGRRRGLQLRAYDDARFSKLSVWEASDPVPDAALGLSGDEEDDEAGEGAGESRGGAEEEGESPRGGVEGRHALDARPGLEDLRGEGYVQVYMVMRPRGGGGGGGSSTRREALFRFGSWVYAGQVDLGVPRLHLGDVPDVLPALQRQQGLLGFLCEAASFPAEHPLTGAVHQFMSAVAFLEKEMVAAEPILSKLAEEGVTSWIDAEWAASFFELAFEETPELRQVEVIACKVYFRSGVVLHGVWFGGSLYCVLSDIVDDAPLLDVAFPDVTARCRGVQVKGYRGGEMDAVFGTSLPLPRPRRLTCWEGRRRGVAGVGWGTVAAVETDLSTEGVGRDIIARARARAEAEEAARQRTIDAMQGRVKQPTPTAAAAAPGTAPAATAKAATPAAPAAAPPHSSSAPSFGEGDGKDDDDVDEDARAGAAAGGGASASASAGAGAGSGAGTGAGLVLPASLSPAKHAAASAGLKPILGLGSAKAPHHLKPLEAGAGGGRILSKLPTLDAAAARAPFDPLTGKPRI